MFRCFPVSYWGTCVMGHASTQIKALDLNLSVKVCKVKHFSMGFKIPAVKDVGRFNLKLLGLQVGL